MPPSTTNEPSVSERIEVHVDDASNNRILDVSSLGTNQNLSFLSLEEKFNAAFNAGCSARLIVDKDLMILRYNKSFQNISTTFLSDNALNCYIGDLDFLKTSQVNQLEHLISSLGRDISMSCLLGVDFGKHKRFFEVSAEPIESNEDIVTAGFVLNFEDVSELERNKTGWSESQLSMGILENELKKLYESVPTELGAHVTNISNLLGTLEQGEVDDSNKGVIEGMRIATSRVIDNLNGFSERLSRYVESSSQGRLPGLNDFIQEVIQDWDQEISRLEAKVDVKIYDDSEWDIPRDPLKMILDQLISNSLKFRKEGVVPKINISVYRQNGKRWVDVKDNGVGINLEGQGQRLFGLFQTFHSHPEARGVGLFQVKNRIKALGGDVILDSKEGKGTTVRLNFN